MKKFFSFIIAFVMMFSMANAQTVVKSNLFENTYVSVFGGGITTTHPQYNSNTVFYPTFWDGVGDLVKGVRPYAGIEIGKYITPVFGLSVEGLAMYNTTGSNTFVDQTNVVGNMKFNLSNWFGGYPGKPRIFEVVLVPGLGWGHDYGDVYVERNYFTYNAGIEFNFNLGKERAWQINVKPVATWNNYHRVRQFHSENLQARVQVGLTYKFGSKKKGSHNFVVCPYSVTQEDYDALKNKYDELVSRGPVVKEVVKTEVKEVVKTVTETKVLAGSTVITFSIGSAALTKVEKEKVALFAKNLDNDTPVQIVGSADTKTGTEKRNFALAQNRANVVKNVLVNEYGISAERITVNTKLDATDSVETSRSAILTLNVE